MYKNVLVAVELGDTAATARAVMAAARVLVGPEVERRVLFVVDTSYLYYYLGTLYASDFLKSVEESISKQAVADLAELCQPFLIDPEHQIVRNGHPAAQIRASAEEFGCDLVVLGTHGRRGWRRVLGSTAGELLHGAKFDVYMTKVPGASEQLESPASAGLEKTA